MTHGGCGSRVLVLSFAAKHRVDLILSLCPSARLPKPASVASSYAPQQTHKDTRWPARGDRIVCGGTHSLAM